MTVLAVLQLVLATFIPIVAALSEANCTDPKFYWVFNSLQQSPCRVGEDIVSPCSPTGFNIPSLPEGSAYFGPTADQADSCRCSSVFYSLISACGACQDRNWVTWSDFTRNCSSVWLTVYANNIPASTTIPHWAYLDVSVNGTFDPNVAFAASGALESTRSPAPSRTGVSAAPSSTSGTSSTSASNPRSSHPSPAGAIAGGVVGGFAGLVLVAGAAIFYYRRSTTERPLGSGHERGTMSASPTIVTRPSPFPVSSSHERVLRPQKLYNPHDPSTYPTRLRTTNPDPITPSMTGSTYNNAPQNSRKPVMGAMHYTGAPEVYPS